jgi:hypothetical protein
LYGNRKIDLAIEAGIVVIEPQITSRELARQLSVVMSKEIHYQVAERAMAAIGWGPDERTAFRSGIIDAPVLVTV